MAFLLVLKIIFSFPAQHEIVFSNYYFQRTIEKKMFDQYCNKSKEILHVCFLRKNQYFHAETLRLPKKYSAEVFNIWARPLVLFTGKEKN